jgi:signal transduction histidine kinase/ABC-type uncharacterized transport system substrate-binding protein
MTTRSAAFLLVLVALPLSVGSLPSPVAAKETRRVLVLFSQERGHPAHDLTELGIRQAFSSNRVFDLELYVEYLDGARFYDAAHAAMRAQYLRHKYAGMKLDAIIAVYPSAVEFLLGNGNAVFPGVPVVACEVPSAFAETLERSPSRRGITGEIIAENTGKILETALRMRPDTKRIALVGGVARTDRYAEEVARKGFERFAGRLELIDLTMLSMEDTLARVASLPPDTIVFYSSIFRDGAGQSFVPRAALSLVSRASNAPVFGLYDSYMGYGIVGGHLASFEWSGRTAGDLALRILSGEWPGAIPFVREQGYVDLYDGRELARWRIPDSTVPAGHTILYREPSLWESHRQAFLAVIAALFLQSILIAVLLVQRSRRRRAELALLDRTGELALANRRLQTEASELIRTRTFLEASQEKFRRLAGSLLTSQEAERGKVARELHDDISQRLAGIAIETGILDRESEDFGAPQKEKLKGVVKELLRLSGDVHLLSRRLHPSALDDLGLPEAMRSECARFSRKHGIAVSFEAEDVPGNLSGDVKLCLYRVLQEGLRNVAKHSGATDACVRLTGDDSALRFELKDNGGGFAPDSEKKQQGLGLISMRERVYLVGGKLSLETKPGDGTVLRATISNRDGHTPDES